MERIFKHVVKNERKDANSLFDSLIGKDTNDINKKFDKLDDSKKVKKPIKRTKNIGDLSSDDEFYITKRGKKSNVSKTGEQNGINLEQEIRECIGVAGRKSQRKCTSGKQNVLTEFWSSDEMSDVEKIEENSDDNPTPEKLSPNVIVQLKETRELNNLEVKKPNRKVNRKSLTPRKTITKKPRVKLIPKNENGMEQPESSVSLAKTRRKRSASEKQLYYWSSSSDEDEINFCEVKPIREDPEDDRPMHHGWIVGDSPKKLVTMLAQAKGNKKVDAVCVKEQGKRNRITL